jgi:hypothetical protein
MPSKNISEFINGFHHYTQILKDLNQSLIDEALCQMILKAINDPDLETTKVVLTMQTVMDPGKLLTLLHMVKTLIWLDNLEGKTICGQVHAYRLWPNGMVKMCLPLML